MILCPNEHESVVKAHRKNFNVLFVLNVDKVYTQCTLTLSTCPRGDIEGMVSYTTPEQRCHSSSKLSKHYIHIGLILFVLKYVRVQTPFVLLFYFSDCPYIAPCWWRNSTYMFY